MGLIGIIIGALVDATEMAAIWSAVMAALGVLLAMGFTAAFLFLAWKLLETVLAIIRMCFGLPNPNVVRRRYINNDGREVIEEIPYDPAMNFVNAAVRTTKEIGYERERQN
jgi:hypothetical protein